jgi:hypothetical protein
MMTLNITFSVVRVCKAITLKNEVSKDMLKSDQTVTKKGDVKIGHHMKNTTLCQKSTLTLMLTIRKALLYVDPLGFKLHFCIAPMGRLKCVFTYLGTNRNQIKVCS